MTWLTFWIGALATYRITILFTRDKLGKPFRELPKVGTLFKCTYCLSVWVGFFVSATIYNTGVDAGILLGILMAFAFSAITIMADRFFTSDYTT